MPSLLEFLHSHLHWSRWSRLGAGAAYGQAITGNVVGTVVDSSGAAVVNADISIVNVATGVGASNKTNGTGEYRFDNLLAGSYKVTVRSSGFRTTAVSVEVRLNTTSTANVKLEPGASTETVEVSGEAPIIDTTTTQLQNTFEGKTLQDLPIANLGVATNGQNLGVINLSLLDAGVGSTGGLGAGTGPSISGQRPRNNNFTIEGVDNNDKGVTGPLIYVSTRRRIKLYSPAEPVQPRVWPLHGRPVQHHR